GRHQSGRRPRRTRIGVADRRTDLFDLGGSRRQHLRGSDQVLHIPRPSLTTGAGPPQMDRRVTTGIRYLTEGRTVPPGSPALVPKGPDLRVGPGRWLRKLWTSV